MNPIHAVPTLLDREKRVTSVCACVRTAFFLHGSISSSVRIKMVWHLTMQVQSELGLRLNFKSKEIRIGNTPLSLFSKRHFHHLGVFFFLSLANLVQVVKTSQSCMSRMTSKTLTHDTKKLPRCNIRSWQYMKLWHPICKTSEYITGAWFVLTNLISYLC